MANPYSRTRGHGGCALSRGVIGGITRVILFL
jgi:hypothetical protein